MDELVANYVESVFRFCLNRLINRQDAEDLAQEIIIQLLIGFRKYEIRNVDAWVWQVARNRYARLIRLKAQVVDEIASYGMEMTLQGDFTEELEVREEHQAVFNALHRLSELYRNIIIDFYVHGISTDDIAEKYDLPVTTVKWRLYHGKEQIKEGLSHMQRIYERINWNTRTCNGSMDSNKYLHSQVARAICLSAYEEPRTIAQISEATGLPAMYVEDELQRLIAGDAVVAANEKYFTNFILLRLRDHRRMAAEFNPYVGKLATVISKYLADIASEVASIGFYGSHWGVNRLGYILVPLALRKATSRVQNTNEKLKYGPYPPRKDGGYGWFVVQETESNDESAFDPAASGCNMYHDKQHPERGMSAYFWIGKYFDNELYCQGMRLMFSKNMMKEISNGIIPEGLLNEEEWAMMVRLNLAQRTNDGLALAIPAFTKAQFDQFAQLIEPFAGQLEPAVANLVVTIWDQFQSFVPARIADQINQYVASYVHRIIGLTLCEMIDKCVLIQLPEKGPLAHGIFFVDRPVRI